MHTPQTTLGIRRRSLDSDICDVFIVDEVPGATATPCSVSWSTFKEKLRDAWSFGDTELDKIQEELFSTGKTLLESRGRTSAQIRALGLS